MKRRREVTGEWMEKAKGWQALGASFTDWTDWRRLQQDRNRNVQPAKNCSGFCNRSRNPILIPMRRDPTCSSNTNRSADNFILFHSLSLMLSPDGAKNEELVVGGL